MPKEHDLPVGAEDMLFCPQHYKIPDKLYYVTKYTDLKGLLNKIEIIYKLSDDTLLKGG